MNTKKFSDYLAKTSELCKDLPIQKHTAIIVSDSKGDYLLKQAERADANCIEKNIVWFTKKGRKTEEAVEWIIGNYEYLLDKYGDFTLYLWSGTCDASLKQNFTNTLSGNATNRYWLSLQPNYELLLNRALRV